MAMAAYMAVPGLGFLLHVVHVACKVLDIMFLMTRCSHRFTKTMTTFSHSCPTCQTSLSHISSVMFRSFSIVYSIDDFW
jgi:hypothetical protein